jgi:formylglycine-generating enzyme required for sulfatase activity
MIEFLGIASGVISLFRDANTSHDIYKKVGGIVHGTDHEKLMNCIQQMQQEQTSHNAKIADSFERLSDRILYAPNLEAIKDNNTSRQRQVDDLRQVRESLDPLQKALGGDLLSSAVILTPEKMQKAFDSDPWQVLIDIRPLARATKPNNPDMVPFLFEEKGAQYIGWQIKGVLPMMFECQYSEIWTPSSANAQQTTNTQTASIQFDFPVPEMVVIPAGSFQMGSNKYSDEQPIHRVDIRCFAMGKYPVTFEQWDACYDDGGCDCQPSDEGWGRGKRPVINVSWQDAQQYCRWLSDKTGEAYRLPSESEWEYATRAGTTTKYWWGNQAPSCRKQAKNGASFDGGKNSDCYYKKSNGDHRGTEPVGSYSPNPFGLYDVHGNVWEWVEDKWHDNYKKSPHDGSAWEVGNSSIRVLRGGSWFIYPLLLRAANRLDRMPDDRFSFIGFRPALGL